MSLKCMKGGCIIKYRNILKINFKLIHKGYRAQHYQLVITERWKTSVDNKGRRRRGGCSIID